MVKGGCCTQRGAELDQFCPSQYTTELPTSWNPRAQVKFITALRNSGSACIIVRPGRSAMALHPSATNVQQHSHISSRPPMAHGSALAPGLLIVAVLGGAEISAHQTKCSGGQKNFVRQNPSAIFIKFHQLSVSNFLSFRLLMHKHEKPSSGGATNCFSREKVKFQSVFNRVQILEGYLFLD